MAALAGLQIDNCEVWVDEAEMPGCDGSSLPFVEALEAAGVVEQDGAAAAAGRARRHAAGQRRQLGRGPARHDRRAERQVSARLRQRQRHRPADAATAGHARIVSPRAGPQPHVRAQGRGRLAGVAQGWASGPRIKNVLVFDEDGPIDNELRFRDECVRHKALDLVGDLALAGCDLVGHFVAHRSGHRLNAELVRALLTEEEIVEGRRRSA